MKTHPELEGTWTWVNWCVVESFDTKKLVVNSNGRGSLNNYSYIGGNQEVKGRVSTEGDDLYIGGEFVYTIIEVVDTSGYIYNPNPPSQCFADSIYVNSILRVKTNSGVLHTYLK